MYGVALFFILRVWYAQGNSGLPNPQVISTPTYLYGILALVADFAGGFPVVLGAGLTVALIWQAQGSEAKAANPATTSVTRTGPHTSVAKVASGGRTTIQHITGP